MTDNKNAARELAEKHVKAVAAWHAAIITLRAAQQALSKAQQETATAASQMAAAADAFGQALGIGSAKDYGDPAGVTMEFTEEQAAAMRRSFQRMVPTLNGSQGGAVCMMPLTDEQKAARKSADAASEAEFHKNCLY